MSSKKAKLSNDDDKSDFAEWDKVREYLRSYPGGSNHPAIQAALLGMDQEQKRRERDAKLQQRFSNGVTVKASSNLEEEEEAVVVEHSPKDNKSNRKKAMEEDDDADATMSSSEDWHDVNEGATEEPASAAPSTGSNSYLGDRLANDVVQLLAQHQVAVSSPTAALAAAFHAALCALQFECTGLPEDETKKSGFAPPVRAISSFLPVGWEKTKQQSPAPIQLRYRQESNGGGRAAPGLASVVLTVQLNPGGGDNDKNHGDTLQITWATRSGAEPTTFTVPLEQYWNRDSWNRASQESTVSASPCLHYKALSALLTQFVQQLDLGDVAARDGAAEAALPAVHYPTERPSATRPTTTGINPMPQPVLPQTGGGMRTTTVEMPGQRPDYAQVPTTIGGAFPGLGRPLNGPGEFSGDLFPGGSMGNLMGPGHPSFVGGGGSGGDGFLQPRFDPYGPPLDPNHPNGPQQQHPPRMRRPPHTPGVPNHDHLRPPNNLNNNNMFM